ncbi:virulence factor SrfC family protein [Mongoliitalea lutea]|uniref:Virulence factor n=1 Tax=Mongoliitalea lutea TaxID=849756 RepID=A0A8J3CWJ1_9BACT|nr:virulence factor SrfC family protein [Mongoliitalea lutea]GHB36323.1 hypothetical protein GCM10008106_17010 [Mongoliitalea lutea]
MRNYIQNQLDIVEDSLTWISTSLDGEKQKQSYRKLVNFRRKLNRKKFAVESNPAVAIYGESQVGKSYLVNNLLSSPEKAFGIKDESGNHFNFLEEINPFGGGSESTSLVSRFSIKAKPINLKYPIQANLLSPADIILVLCDSYYNDIKADIGTVLGTEEVNSAIKNLKNELRNINYHQSFLNEDDILDIQEYFKEHFSNKASNILTSNFFEEVSFFIAKTRPNEWKNIFSYLWNHNPIFTMLFRDLISEYDRMNFTPSVYLPIEAVLRKHGTLLDVERIKEIYSSTDKKIEVDYREDTPAIWMEGILEKNMIIKKSFLCALSSELIFPQDKSLLETKPFLRETDLLDFPGARGRLTLGEADIKNENVWELLLRGKVAYLFNKYSEAEKINVFMLCAKHDQPGARSIPEMLNSWIKKFIGDTPEKRERFIENSKISPLFIVGTFFNINLEYNNIHDSSQDLTSLNYRWQQRFEKTLSVQILNSETYGWFNNWTKTHQNFNNIYLLRDFNYSKNIFNDYQKLKRETTEIKPAGFPDFRERLKESFLNYPFVKKHFPDPNQSWDEAATVNKDGTDLIIKNLTIASENINEARKARIQVELQEILNALNTELFKYYHSNDKDEQLQKAKSKAGSIQLLLDTAFSADGIKNFGRLIKDFMINEGLVLELFKKKIDDIEHRDVVNLDIYSTYRMQVPVLPGDTKGTYFERLCAHYERNTEEEKNNFEQELALKNIDLDELLVGNINRIKNSAQQLSEELLEYWFVYIALHEKKYIQTILGGDNSSAFHDLIEMYQQLFEKIKLSKIIAERIRSHVDGVFKTEIPFEIIADISSEILNNAILSVGLEYFDSSQLSDLVQANEKSKLGLNFSQSDDSTHTSIEELFERVENWTDIIQQNPSEMKFMPHYQNYLTWYNKLKIGFVSVCDIPNYNVQANNELAKIIDKAKALNADQ